MDDEEILRLYWARDEAAIPATAEKYGGYCTAIARNILGDRQDAEECVNDTWLRAWNAIPPHRPAVLAAFLGKITRNLAFNRSQYRTAARRGSGNLPTVLDELNELISGGDSPEQELQNRELSAAIEEFLADLPREKRNIFICRYWYTDSLADIAARFGMTEGAVAMTLHRLRQKLRRHLTERGFPL